MCCATGVASQIEVPDGDLGSSVSTYPYFEFNVPRNVTTAVGQTAFLHCRVQQLGDKAVSSSVLLSNLRYYTTQPAPNET